MKIPNFVGPEMDFNSGQQSSSGRNGGGGGGGTEPFRCDSTTEHQDKNQAQTQRADHLVTLVTETIRPEISRDNGGTATIRYFNGHLIVTAPPLRSRSHQRCTR